MDDGVCVVKSGGRDVGVYYEGGRSAGRDWETWLTKTSPQRE